METSRCRQSDAASTEPAHPGGACTWPDQIFMNSSILRYASTNYTITARIGDWWNGVQRSFCRAKSLRGPLPTWVKTRSEGDPKRCRLHSQDETLDGRSKTSVWSRRKCSAGPRLRSCSRATRWCQCCKLPNATSSVVARQKRANPRHRCEMSSPARPARTALPRAPRSSLTATAGT